jgi:hypothetical protein
VLPVPLVHGKHRRFRRSSLFRTFQAGYSNFRTNCEQSSIIHEHCSTLFELRSMSSGRITIAKPLGLGMVSSRELKLFE